MEHDILKIPTLEYDAEMSICPKIWNELVSELASELRHLGSDKISRIVLINKLSGEFDGTTLEFYEYLKNYNK